MARNTRRRLVVIALALICWPTEGASAQWRSPGFRESREPATTEEKNGAADEPPNFQQIPARGSRQRPSRRSEHGHSLIVTANVLGGYDDNAGTASGSGAGSVPVAATSGSTALADVMLEYFRKSPQRSLGVRGLANVTMYPDYLDDAASGGKFRVFGTTSLGANHRLEASAQVRYEPFFTAIAEEFTDVRGIEETAGRANTLPTATLFERRSWVSSNKAYLHRRWSTRDRTVLSYLFFAQTFTDHSGNNRYHEAAASYSRVLTRNTALATNYQFTSGQQTDGSGVTRPNTEHTVTGGPDLTTTVLGRRPLSLRLRAGGAFVRTRDTSLGQDLEGWMPTASASGDWEPNQKWRLSAAYNHGFSMLQGLTSEFYATHSTRIGATARVMPATDIACAGTIANGRTALMNHTDDMFKIYGSSVSIRVSLGSTWAATAGYFYYRQRYDNPAALPTGFPARYDRHAVSVGLTLWTRVAGNLPAAPRGPSDW